MTSGDILISTNPKRVPGRWREGFALDQHTMSSVFVGYDEFGHERFDTKRSPAGDLMYALKYQSDQAAIAPLAEAAAAFLQGGKPPLRVILPVRASRTRAVQPVMLLATEIATRTGLSIDPDVVKRVKDVPELKNIHDFSERLKLLADAHAVDCSKVSGKSVLLFDDLYRSGATMNAIANVLYDSCKVTDVYVLTITKTRSNT